MSLAGNIDDRVWLAVQASYESGDYSGAILDSVFYLSELIRNKSALDSDGNALVGSAFGGTNPIIKVNSLHTDSERDEQRGVEQLLRGIYTAIRNPRAHEKRTDSAETADAVIAFVAWVSSLIDRSKSPFDTEQIVKSVFDKHFAQNERYADLLVERIPKRKRLDLLITVFQRRQAGDYKCLRLFTQSVLKTFLPEEQDQFWQVVSEALEDASADADFRSAIQLAQDGWLKVSELARIRAEHRLIESIKEGQYDSSRDVLLRGGLGTWARVLATEFTLKDELANAISLRLLSDDRHARSYIFEYFLFTYKHLRPTPPEWLVRSLKKRLSEDHDEDVYKALEWAKVGSDDEVDPWQKALGDALELFNPSAAQSQAAEISDDDIPF